MFRGSVKSTGYPLLSPLSPSLPHPWVTVCRHISTGLYSRVWSIPLLILIPARDGNGHLHTPVDLHNEELNDPYCSPNIVRVTKSRRMRWAEHVALMGERRGVYRILVGKTEVKRPCGRPWRRWEDNIKM